MPASDGAGIKAESTRCRDAIAVDSEETSLGPLLGASATPTATTRAVNRMGSQPALVTPAGVRWEPAAGRERGTIHAGCFHESSS